MRQPFLLSHIMNHVQISIAANEPQQEELIAYLNDLGATGFEQTDTHLLVYFPEDNFQSYEVHGLLKKFEHNITTVPQQNWNAVWEQNFEPVVVGNFCAVRAHFHQPIQDVQHEIVITPKMSFGTGHHATTYMMMEQMQDIDFINKTVFDFGTGTGILAILAEKLGAVSVAAIDNDEWSLENIKENIEKNGCTAIEASLSSRLPIDKTFDVVLANINRNVLLKYVDQLHIITKQDGYLLVSGLLYSDKEEIVNAFQKQGMVLKKEAERNNWLALLFVK